MQTLTRIIGLILVVTMGIISCSEAPKPLILQPVGTTPDTEGTLPANGVIKVAFNDYLDPESIEKTEVVVKSGAERVTLHLGYDPIDKALLIMPRIGLRVGVSYEVTVSAEHLRSLSGARLERDFDWTFRVGEPVDNPDRQALDFDTDIKPIFDMSCSCHGPEPKLFPELRPETLIRNPSVRQPDRDLVVPGQPLDSYLIQRLLPNYPTVRGPTKTLSDSDKRQLLRWVRDMSGTR